MKCPMRFPVDFADITKEPFSLVDCLKEECAWWEDTIGKCSIRRIWITLQDIHEVLHDIAKRMTLGGE